MDVNQVKCIEFNRTVVLMVTAKLIGSYIINKANLNKRRDLVAKFSEQGFLHYRLKFLTYLCINLFLLKFLHYVEITIKAEKEEQLLTLTIFITNLEDGPLALTPPPPPLHNRSS